MTTTVAQLESSGVISLASNDTRTGVFLTLAAYNKLLEAATTTQPCPDCKGTGNPGRGCSTCQGHGHLIVAGKVDLPYRLTGMTIKQYFDKLNGRGEFA